MWIYDGSMWLLKILWRSQLERVWSRRYVVLESVFSGVKGLVGILCCFTGYMLYGFSNWVPHCLFSIY